MFDIVTDSACDLTPDMVRQLGLTVVPFYVSTDGERYLKEGQDIAVRDFYQFMVDHPETLPKTSLPSLEDFEKVFREKAAAGRETLCLCFTGKMSGGVGSARNARELVLEDYPQAVIEVVDTGAATVSEGAAVLNAAAMRDAGCTLTETLTWLAGTRPTNQIFFTVGNLDYLNGKPMIHFADGEIFSGGMARGRQKSMEKAIEQLLGYLAERKADPDDYRIIAGYGYDADEGRRFWMQLRAALRARYPASECDAGLLQIGATIAVHTGPYALGVGVMRKWKKKA